MFFFLLHIFYFSLHTKFYSNFYLCLKRKQLPIEEIETYAARYCIILIEEKKFIWGCCEIVLPLQEFTFFPYVYVYLESEAYYVFI